MITVATKLDVPIKLTFEAASRRSILGLGDIVLPGMVMAFALRLDLWLHYQRKIKYEATELQAVSKDPPSATGLASAASSTTTTTTTTKSREVKAPYVDVRGGWGERFWASDGFVLASRARVPPSVAASSFPKTYFTASVVGYALGMAATLAMLLVYRRGQPALLYLVPGVLGALYLTAYRRGEMALVWSYTEDGSLDTVDAVVDLDAAGRVVGRVDDTAEVGEMGKTEEVKKTETGTQTARWDRQILLISLEALDEGQHRRH
jgi:minor histocompatibility antigen H13